MIESKAARIFIALALSFFILYIFSGPARNSLFSTMIWFSNNYVSEINHGILATMSFEPYDPRIDSRADGPDDRLWRQSRSNRHTLVRNTLPLATVLFFTWTIFRIWNRIESFFLMSDKYKERNLPYKILIGTEKNIYWIFLIIFVVLFYNYLKIKLGYDIQLDLHYDVHLLHSYIQYEEALDLYRRALYISNMGEYKSLVMRLDALAAEHGVTLPPRRYTLR